MQILLKMKTKPRMCIYLFLLCVCSTSCFRANNGEKRSNVYADSIGLVAEEVSIPPSEVLLLKSYPLSSSCRADSTLVVVGYNYKEHALDFIELNSKKTVQLKLNQEGPSGITRRIGGLYVHNLDSIWLCDDTQQAYLINSKGEMKNKIALNDGESDGVVAVMANYAMSVIKLYYNERRQSLFYAVEIVVNDIPKLVVKERALDQQKPIGSYELTPSVVEPNITVKDYGYIYRPNISFTDDLIVYNYPIESSVYTIDLNTGARKTISGESKFTPNVVPKCVSAPTYEARELFALENVCFHEIMHLSASDLYARLHVSGVDTADEKDPGKLNAGRKLLLTLFNRDFEIVNELELPSRRYSYYTGWCALDEGILIFVDNILSGSDASEELIFDVYRPV